MPVDTPAKRNYRFPNVAAVAGNSAPVAGEGANPEAAGVVAAVTQQTLQGMVRASTSSLGLGEGASNPIPVSSVAAALTELSTLRGTTAVREEEEENDNGYTMPHFSFGALNIEPGHRAIKRLQAELKKFQNDPPENCSAELEDNNLFRWNATIHGPNGTPYENGIFNIKIIFPTNFPFDAPQVMFTTKIYHVNIGKWGTVCLDILNEKWTPILTVAKILLSLQVLLGNPNFEEPFNYAIAVQFKNNPGQHDAEARKWTQVYAMPKNSDFGTFSLSQNPN